MRFGTVASVALVITLLGCSKPDAPEPKPAPAPLSAKPAAAPPPPPNAAARPQAAPAAPLPTIVVQKPADVPEDPRRKETPCDRNEPGWKWVGTVVENGQCAVGPCDCVQD